MSKELIRSGYLQKYGSNQLINFRGWRDGVSSCCGSKVENESDICTNCHKPCEVENQEEDK